MQNIKVLILLLKYLFTAILILWFDSRLFAQQNSQTTNYQFTWGTSPNLESISMNFMSLSNLTFDLTTDTLHNSSYDSTFSRFANSFVQLVLGNSIWAMAPHELGHVSRAHEYGVNAEVVSIMPFDGWYKYTTPYYSISPEKRMMISAAGQSVNTLELYDISMQMYSGKAVPAYYGIYELMRFIPIISYTVNYHSYLDDPESYLKKSNFNQPGDTFAYGLSLAEIYARKRGYLSAYTGGNENLPYYLNSTMMGFMKDQSRRMMIAYSLLLLDPALLSAGYGTVYGYIINGETSFKPWMFHIGDVRFMPSIRADMGQIGVENYFDMFFLIKNFPQFSIYYRYGGNENDSLHGSGLEIRDIRIAGNFSISIQADYWNSFMNRFGFNTSVRSSIKINRVVNIIFSTGFKTEGIVVGLQTDKGFYGNAGIGITF
jgi:hypothetical protein